MRRTPHLSHLMWPKVWQRANRALRLWPDAIAIKKWRPSWRWDDGRDDFAIGSNGCLAKADRPSAKPLPQPPNAETMGGQGPRKAREMRPPNRWTRTTSSPCSSPPNPRGTRPRVGGLWAEGRQDLGTLPPPVRCLPAGGRPDTVGGTTMGWRGLWPGAGGVSPVALSGVNAQPWWAMNALSIFIILRSKGTPFVGCLPLSAAVLSRSAFFFFGRWEEASAPLFCPRGGGGGRRYCRCDQGGLGLSHWSMWPCDGRLGAQSSGGRPPWMTVRPRREESRVLAWRGTGDRTPEHWVCTACSPSGGVETIAGWEDTPCTRLSWETGDGTPTSWGTFQLVMTTKRRPTTRETSDACSPSGGAETPAGWEPGNTSEPWLEPLAGRYPPRTEKGPRLLADGTASGGRSRDSRLGWNPGRRAPWFNGLAVEHGKILGQIGSFTNRDWFIFGLGKNIKDIYQKDRSTYMGTYKFPGMHSVEGR